jgi:lipid-binding SYLF domain-containing protein
MHARRTILALPLAALLPAAASAATAAETVSGSQRLLTRFKGNVQWEGIWNLIGASQAVLVAPSISGGGLIVAGQTGDGLLFSRHGATWSDPVGVTLNQVSVGFQAGVQQYGLALSILSRAALARLVRGGISGGGSGGFSLGDLGVGGQASGSGGGIETLAVTVSESGLFAGSGLGGMKLSPSAALNQSFHGGAARPEATLERAGGQVAAASPVRALLAEATRTSFGAMR